VAAGVTDVLIPDFAAAFAFDFDFQREIRPGDIFEAAIEEHTDGSGQTVGPARLVYASLQTAQKSRALYRFRPPGEAQLAWFDGDGKSIVRSLMRTPVEGARISSSFGARKHPVLGYTRMHKGTDFATPIGTPVYASGDGVVDFMGVHGGHGNYIRVRHTKTLETAYAHLSAYGAGLQVGSPVVQGQIVARSGNTGLSSGPHLHYEVIIDGEQVDPMTYQTTSGRNLAGAALQAFLKERDRIDVLRAEQNR
jgi:murein DD-endopeptidase MepM/ murein hydrolase activator NlpD